MAHSRRFALFMWIRNRNVDPKVVHGFEVSAAIWISLRELKIRAHSLQAG
jgi:hypothetical protein